METDRQKLEFLTTNFDSHKLYAATAETFGLNVEKRKHILFHALMASLFQKELNCYICGSPIVKFSLSKEAHFENGQHITYDHIWPDSYNGTSHVLNGRATCFCCNNKRGNELKFETYKGKIEITPESYYARRDVLSDVKFQLNQKGIDFNHKIHTLMKTINDKSKGFLRKKEVAELERFLNSIGMTVELNLEKYSTAIIGQINYI